MSSVHCQQIHIFVLCNGYLATWTRGLYSGALHLCWVDGVAGRDRTGSGERLSAAFLCHSSLKENIIYVPLRVREWVSWKQQPSLDWPALGSSKRVLNLCSSHATAAVSHPFPWNSLKSWHTSDESCFFQLLFIGLSLPPLQPQKGLWWPV